MQKPRVRFKEKNKAACLKVKDFLLYRMFGSLRRTYIKTSSNHGSYALDHFISVNDLWIIKSELNTNDFLRIR